MVEFITLHGSLSGSIKLITAGKSTRFILRLRGKPPRGGFTVYLIHGESFSAFRFSADLAEFVGTVSGGFPCEADAPRICAAVIANTFGDFVAEGSIGATRPNLQAVKARIRAVDRAEPAKAFNAAESKKALSAAVGERAMRAEPGKSGQTGRDMRPHGSAADAPPAVSAREAKSPVTEGILGKARELFTGNESPTAAERSSAAPRAAFDANAGSLCENCARSDESAIENPFPQLFPNSYWKKRQNDRRLFGKARVRGVMYGIVAVPSSSRRPPAGLCGNLRRVRASNGNMFWLGIRREQPNANP